MTANRPCFLLLPLLILAGCSFPAPAPDVYERHETGRVHSVVYGEVQSVRPVPIAGRQTVIGRLGGAYVGGAVGSAGGDGAGEAILSGVGAVAGAVAGEAAEERLTRKDGLEITLLLDSGDVITIVQEADLTFAEGERVRVLMRGNESGRVLKN